MAAPQPPPQPSPQQPPTPGQPQTSPRLTSPMRNALGLAIVGGLIVALLLALLLGAPTRQLSPSAFQDEFVGWIESGGDFPNLEPGDTVYLSGTITRISQKTGSITAVFFGAEELLFKGNLPDSCHVGGQLSVTFHIIEKNVDGKTVEWIEEFGLYDAGIPTDLVTCTG